MNRLLVEAIVDDLERQIQFRKDDMAPHGGMRVPYRGPFCSAQPSVVKDLEILASALRRALAGEQS